MREPPPLRHKLPGSDAGRPRNKSSPEGSISAAELTHQRRPERVHSSYRGKIDGLLVHGRVHHDELALRIDIDPLPAHAPEHEHAVLAGKDPRLVAVAEEWRQSPWPRLRLIRARCRRVPDPCRRDDLAPVPVAIVSQQQPEARVVAQHGVEAAVGGLLPGVVDEPRRVCLGSDELLCLRLQLWLQLCLRLPMSRRAARLCVRCAYGSSVR